MRPPHFVLIHAPLVGPMTWSLTASALRKKGFLVTLPALTRERGQNIPYWRQHAAAVAAAVAAAAAGAGFETGEHAPGFPLVLVAHSGPGPLLPAVHQALGRLPAAEILVDALFPEDGKRYLDMFEDARAAEEFRGSAVNGLLPVWTEDDLRAVITDDAVLRGFVEELRPLPLAVYEEPIPVYAAWPDAPAAYLRFGENPAYDLSFRRARQAGWPVEQIDGQHFDMLEHPERVAQALVDLARRLGIPVTEEGNNA